VLLDGDRGLPVDGSAFIALCPRIMEEAEHRAPPLILGTESALGSLASVALSSAQ